jgi:hypothetical protein
MRDQGVSARPALLRYVLSRALFVLLVILFDWEWCCPSSLVCHLSFSRVMEGAAGCGPAAASISRSGIGVALPAGNAAAADGSAVRCRVRSTRSFASRCYRCIDLWQEVFSSYAGSNASQSASRSGSAKDVILRRPVRATVVGITGAHFVWEPFARASVPPHDSQPTAASRRSMDLAAARRSSDGAGFR